MKFRIRTLGRRICRQRPLCDDIKRFDAFDRAFDQFGQELGVEEVVVLERPQPAPHTFQQSLLDVIKAIRKDTVAIETLEQHGRKLCLLFFEKDSVMVDITEISEAYAVRKILREVM
jgi:hypothetical protein